MEGGNAGVATYRPGAEARLKWMTVPAVEADAQCLVRSWRKKRERARRDKAERQDKSKPNENETRLAPFSKILIGRSNGCVVATTKSFFTHPRVPVKKELLPTRFRTHRRTHEHTKTISTGPHRTKMLLKNE